MEEPQRKKMQFLKPVLAISVLIAFTVSTAAIDINSSKALQYYGGTSPANLDFMVETDGAITATNDLNMSYNNITQPGFITDYFQSQCSGSNVVDGINPDGSYKCVDVSTLSTTENLNQTLTAGNLANQSIGMTGNNINGIGNAGFSGSIQIGAGGNVVVIGQNANSGTNGQVVIGSSANAGSNNNAVVIGSSATSDLRKRAVAIGYSSRALGFDTVAIGANADIDQAESAIAIGDSATIGDNNDERAIAIGGSTYANAANSTIIGYNTGADASARYSAVLGAESYTSAPKSAVLGSYSSATENASVAIGFNTTAPNQYEATFGNLGAQKLDVNITGNLTVHDSIVGTDGTEVADFRSTGVTMYQPLSIESGSGLSVQNGVTLTDSTSNTIDSYSTFYLTTSSGSPSDIVLDPTGVVGVQSNLDMGNNNITNCNYINGVDCNKLDASTKNENLNQTLEAGNLANQSIRMTGNNITGVGRQHFAGNITIGNVSTRVDSLESLAIGRGAAVNSNSKRSVAIGDYASVTGTKGLAVGTGATADASREAIAIGPDASATALDTIVIGESSSVSADESTVVGEKSDATAQNAVVLGERGLASGEGAVAIGADVDENAGTGAQATASDTVALGRDSSASAVNSVAIGAAAIAPNSYEATFGNLGSERLDVNVTGNLTVHGLEGLTFTASNPKINGFFANTCSGSNEVVKRVFANGTYVCDTIPEDTGTEPLNDTLQAGNIANQSIYMNGNSIRSVGFEDVESLNITNTSTGDWIASFEESGVDLYQPLSLHSDGGLSVDGGITLTDGTSNTIESYSTMYLSTSSGSPTDIVLQPSGDVGVQSNLSVIGELDGGGEPLKMGDNLDMNGYNITDSTSGNVTIDDSLKVHGNIWTSGADLAEVYNSTQELEPGSVVSISTERDDSVVRSREAYDSDVFGVVSGNPSYVMNTGEKGYPIALQGKVEVNVSEENGAIQRGDRVVPSSTPGVAMRCEVKSVEDAENFTEFKQLSEKNRKCRDSTIGKALEESNGDGRILVAVG